MGKQPFGFEKVFFTCLQTVFLGNLQRKPYVGLGGHNLFRDAIMLIQLFSIFKKARQKFAKEHRVSCFSAKTL